FVNRRWVLSHMLTAALEEAYHSLLLSGRHPIAVVNIAIDPTLLDVNVHPAKTEIRFLKERRVYGAVLRAVRSALLEDAEMPSWGKGRNGAQSAPATMSQATAAPEEQGETTAAANPIEPDIDDEATTFPEDNPWITVTEEETGTKPPLLSRLWQSHVHRDEDSVPPALEPASSATGGENKQPDTTQRELVNKNVGAPLAGALNAGDQGTLAMNVGTFHGESTSLEQNSAVDAIPFALVSQSAMTEASRRLPSLRVIGQLSQSYIVTEGPEGMYLVDQHAAHERILLERMVPALQARAPVSQILLTPIQLELAPSELEAIEDRRQQLEHIGFALELHDNSTIAITAVPNVLVKQMNARSLRELLADLTTVENTGHSETWEEHALANVACKAAIKANYFLTVSEMREMIEQLGQTNAPFSCCHGRPTMVHFSLSALEHEFGRR
ncbi:MAG: hypothetical protein E6J22_09545, partial [Chloroflexi bacterium]